MKLKDDESRFVLDTIASRFKIASNYQEKIFNNFSDYYEYYRGSEEVKDSQTWRAKIHVPYIKQVIDTIMPRLVSSRPKVNVLPREESDILASQQMEKFVDYQCEEGRLYEKIKLWCKTALIYGVGLMKVGWDEDGLWVENISNYDFFKDPNTSRIDDSWCIFKQERDLASLKKNKNYDTSDIESALSSDKSEWKEKEQGSLGRSDPQSDSRKKVVVYEYYGKMSLEKDGDEEDYLIVTANNQKILRITPLEEVYPCGSPIVALVDDPMPLDFWAIGEVEPLIPLEDELNTLRNQRLDNRKLIINNMWLVNKNGGINWDDFVSRPGGIIECDDVNAVKPLAPPDTTRGSVEEEAIIKQDMDRTSGVFPGMMGQIQKPMGATGNVNETARGFLAALEQAGTRMQYKLDNLDDALRELGAKIIKLDQKYLKTDQVIRVVGKGGIAFETIPKDAIGKEYDLRIESGSTQPQSPEVKRQEAMQIMQLLMPLSQMPLYDYEPGTPPIPTQLNAKWVIDLILDKFDLPNKEEAFIQMGVPQGTPQPMNYGQTNPIGQNPGGETPPQGVPIAGTA